MRIGFMPSSHAIADAEHPGLLRAGERASAPYVDDSVDYHVCEAVDLCREDAVRPDLLQFGFDTVDLSSLDDLQQTLAQVRSAGVITDDDASSIRSLLDGTTLRSSGHGQLKVMHIADEGLIMRKSGPNGMSVVGPRSTGMNDHGVASSIHADQDVYGTPLTQLMDGRAPSLFRHDSPDGRNGDAALMLVNLWIPLQQVTQPLTLADGRSIDRRRHQLRYGLATTSFLERQEDMVINDIWTFLHSPGQEWYLRSDMDQRSAYVFNTLSTPHGSCTLPGEDVAERCYRALEEAEAAVVAGNADSVRVAVATIAGVSAPSLSPPALSDAITQMVAVAGMAADDPAGVCGDGSAEWLAASRASRGRVVRMSLELRMVVSVEPASHN
ncbi:MAG: hypothetical protein R2716_02055 [Microthrixaceae bacterium]